MKLNKWVKVAFIVLPVIAVTACTTDNRRDDNYGGNENNYQSSSADAQREAVLRELQKSNLVYFDFDKYNIKSDFAEFLNHHAAFLRANPEYHVIIEGHADERGTPEYNIALGERRANAVKMYLQGRGVSGDQISIVSYGKEKPAVLGHNESAYAQNRRAVIVY